jgi:hypothetical protein
MKPKIGRGSGFRGLLQYTHDVGPLGTGEKKSERVGGNMSGTTVNELCQEFAVFRKLRPDCTRPVWHSSLSCPDSEVLSTQQWDAITTAYLTKMGLDPSKFPYDARRHSDTDYDHAHIVASRIAIDGTLWHGQNDVLKAIEVCQELEKEFGLKLTPGFDPEHKKERKSLTHGELNMAIRTEKKPPRLECQEAIDSVLRDSPVITAPDFIARLDALGVRAVPSVASTGTMNGFSFEVDGISFTGSKLGDGYKWAKLQLKGVEYDKTRDFAALADVKRSAAERVANAGSVGRDNATTHEGSEPSAAAERVETTSGPDHRASDSRFGTPDDTAAGRGARTGGVRPGEPGAKNESRSVVQRDSQQSSQVDAGEDRLYESAAFGNVGSPGGVEQSVRSTDSSGERSGSNTEEDHRRGERIDSSTGEILGSTQRSGGSTEQEYVADNIFNSSVQQPSNSSVGYGWNSIFKLASANAKKKKPDQEVPKKKRVEEQYIDFARTTDPSGYLESCGFRVRQEGRHLSIRDSTGDERYRITRKPDGHWIACDKHSNGIGDNISLVQDIEHGLGFADAVYMLSGSPASTSTSLVRNIVDKVVERIAPEVPTQLDMYIKAGRKYLHGRGIDIETIEYAEKAGMLRYCSVGVLFVGSDENNIAQNITRRAIYASTKLQKWDFKGSDKRHPQHLPGAPDTVWIVEGGVDALAAHDLARRRQKPPPTVLVTGGANARGFLETPWVQKILRLAKRIIVAFERESSAEKQALTDTAHKEQMQKLQEVCAGQVISWKPPEGIKDIAELNLEELNNLQDDNIDTDDQYVRDV